MKAVLSNRIYLSADQPLKEKLDKELTHLIPAYNPTDPPIVIKNWAPVRDNLVTIPIGRTDLIPENYEIVDKRIINEVEFPEFKGILREDQEEIVSQITDSCIINAKPSWGKSFAGLAIAKKLGQKTLVITHNTNLRTQWVKLTKELFGITPSIIGSAKFETDGPIIIGNIQTLYRRIDKIRKMFGLIILDEMHHASSPTFSRLIDTNYARYKIGLSGTIERKDGKHVVFRDYFGSTVYKPVPTNFMTPKVQIIESSTRLIDGANIPWAKRIDSIVYNEEYQNLVAFLAAAYGAQGHKVLILSSRVHFLKICKELCGPEAGLIIGEKSQEEREEIMKKIQTGELKQIFATQTIFSEGLSLNELSCVILAEPINNDPLLEQIIGRIQRKLEGKPTPIVVDIHLKGKTANRQASARMGFYIKQGFPVETL